ncbi:peroxisomal protein Pex21p [Monosporozyma servazzii]
MSDSCHVNPLQQLNSKNNLQLHNQHHNTFNHTSPHAGSFSGYNAKETAFMNQGQNGLLHHQQGPLSPPLNGSSRQLGHTLSHNTDVSDEWLNQFSSMKVHDPLEFSNDYKKLYENYARNGTIGTPTPACSPQPIQQQQVNTHINHRPLLSRDNQSGYFPSFRTTQPTASQWNTTAPLSAPELNSTNGHGNIDSYFDLEFDNVENELQQQENGSTIQDQMNMEQVEFQKHAQDIVRSCTPDIPASPDHTDSSQLRSKFASSKFIGLMRKVSDGVVTIKKTERELFTPETGEVVGNEYFPVLDERQEQL